jgi:hypothetical protein
MEAENFAVERQRSLHVAYTKRISKNR